MAHSSTDGLITLVRGNEQIAAVESLRKEAYENSPQFQVANKDAWAWTEADNKGRVLAVWDREGRPLATMRGIFAQNRADAQNQLECTVTLPPAWFPTLVLEKAATRSQIAAKGLNSVLRYVFIEAALSYKLGSVIGAVFEGAPRIETMVELGYQFARPEHMWDPNFKQYKPVLIGALPRKEMAMASLKLRTRYEQTIAKFPYRDSLIQLPIVQNDEVSRDVES